MSFISFISSTANLNRKIIVTNFPVSDMAIVKCDTSMSSNIKVVSFCHKCSYYCTTFFLKYDTITCVTELSLKCVANLVTNYNENQLSFNFGLLSTFMPLFRVVFVSVINVAIIALFFLSYDTVMCDIELIFKYVANLVTIYNENQACPWIMDY